MTSCAAPVSRRPGVRSIWIVALALAAGCSRAPDAGGPLPVVASFYPLGEFSQRIGGTRAGVTNLIPAGMEPHEYEPTPQDLVRLKRARVVVYNGAGLEPWVARLLPEIPATVVQVNATAGLPLVTVDGATVRPRDRGAAGPVVDPHVWLDPLLAREQARRILAGLVQADPAGRGEYETHAAALDLDFMAVHRRFTGGLAQCARREFVTTHAAFGYLARRYGLTQVAIVGLSPDAEPSPARLVEVTALVRQHRIPVIFYDTLAGPRLADVVAREAGAGTAALNPLEGLTVEEQREGKTYFTVMYENLAGLIEGLGCRR